MDEIMKSINQLSDSGIQQILFSEQQLFTALIVSAVVGLIICFFGVKLVRVFAAISGLVLGIAIGFPVAYLTGVSDMAFLGVICACGIILAVLSCIFYRAGLFIWAFLIGAFAGLIFIRPDSPVMVLVCLGIGLVLAIVTAIFWKPLVIIVSAVWGGMSAGTSIAAMTPFENNVWITLAICAVLAVLGIIVQFMLKSREVAKKDRVYSKKIKENDSRETEVEKARRLLDEDVELPDDEDDNSDEDMEYLDDDFDELDEETDDDITFLDE